jgi:hypothetical protein
MLASCGLLIDDGGNMAEHVMDFWEKSTMFSTMIPPSFLTSETIDYKVLSCGGSIGLQK